MSTVTTIGFIGLGVMGSGMARNLIRRGYQVRLYNRSRSRAEEVARLGGVVTASPAEAARDADVVITMVSDPTALLAVISGHQGVLYGIRPGAVLIDSSTVSPPATLEVHALLQARGAEMLDAPVFGSKNEAEKGELSFIVGGAAETLSRVKDVFACLGRTNHVGGIGMGVQAKLSVNLVMAGTLQAFNEAMVLATKAGIDPAAMLQIILSSRGRSGIIEMKAPQILKRDFSPFFSLQLMAKDMRLVLESARALGVELPFTTALSDIYARCVADGFAMEDFIATIKPLEKQAALEVKSPANPR